MKIALLSDIHGNLLALHAVVAHLGDSLSGPLLPLETAQFLMQRNWLTLAGNHDRQLLTLPPALMGASDAYAHARLTPAAFDWLRSLPATIRYHTDVLLCHGTPDSDTTYLLETVVAAHHVRMATPEEITQRLNGTTAALIACGHTHVARVCSSINGQTFLNPGSVGLPAYADGDPAPHTMESGSPHARYAVAERI